jgi:1-acyl-sn-glycerol-3-phosphate acyltransferase
MGRLDMIHIDRSKRAEAWNKVAEQGRRLMAQGNWVIMFPEGTRTERGGQGTYKSGAARLAIATGVPIVPIAVTSARCWPRKSFLLRPGVIDVSIGRRSPRPGASPTS